MKENKEKSRYIPQSIKDEVWGRDGGKCVDCGSTENIEYDHITPYSKGGTHTADNITLRCRKCNHLKGDRDHLCPECETYWVKKQYDVCYRCHMKNYYKEYLNEEMIEDYGEDWEDEFFDIFDNLNLKTW